MKIKFHTFLYTFFILLGMVRLGMICSLYLGGEGVAMSMYLILTTRVVAVKRKGERGREGKTPQESGRESASRPAN